MVQKLDIYIAGALLLVAGVYLKSSSVCIAAVVLWAVAVAENVLSKASKDAEIVKLLSRMEKLEQDHRHLTQDITNVAERAKTILGENF
jgi:hypothetical protein